MDKVEIAKETLQNYIDKRYSQTQIAVELGVSQGTVFKKMKEYGLKTKTKQSTYDEQVVIKMLQNGCTSKQIAEYFGTCSETVTNWIRKYGLGKYRKKKNRRKYLIQRNVGHVSMEHGKSLQKYTNAIITVKPAIAGIWDSRKQNVRNM